MPAGNLFNAIQAFQQSSDWMAKQRQQQQMQNALAALAQMKPMGSPQGSAGPSDPGMTPDQSAGAAQNAQSAAQAVGWPVQSQTGPMGAPNAAPASSVANPGAVANDPNKIAMLAAMAKGGGNQPQQPQMPVPDAPSMAQPRAPMKQPPVPGMSSTAQPDAAGMDDPVVAASQSLDAIRSSIKAGNPNIDPVTLQMAVQQQLENIKGVSPLTKAAMGMQVSLMNYGLKQQMLQQRIQGEDQKWQIARQNANTREERNQIDADHFKRMEDLAQGRIDASIANNERTNAARVTTAQIGASARQYAADKGYARGIDTANINQGGANARAGIGAEGKRGAAVTGAYTRAYSAFMANSPNATPEQAQAAAEAAADAVAAMMPATPTPAANVPSGDPLAGQGKPAGRPVLTARPPGGGGGPKPSARGGAPSSSRRPVKVSGPDQIRKLPKGTPWVSADGSRSGVAP